MSVDDAELRAITKELFPHGAPPDEEEAGGIPVVIMREPHGHEMRPAGPHGAEPAKKPVVIGGYL